jgi:hypothetical protein
MDMPDRTSRRCKLIGLFTLAMLHWAMILAVCPALHELIHHDAADEHHECAVTAILSGGVELLPVVPIVAVVSAPVLELIEMSFDERSCGSFFLSCHILEHAPPLRD